VLDPRAKLQWEGKSETTNPLIQVPRESRMREIRMSGLTRGKGAGGSTAGSLLYSTAFWGSASSLVKW
ncbi:MAG: hypothetical protein ACKV19_17220, partial [Verrucomicrobiales bacterium]